MATGRTDRAASTTRERPSALKEVGIPSSVAHSVQGVGGAAEIKPIVVRPTVGPVLSDSQDLRAFGPQHVFETGARRGLGWLRDTPDFRDTTLGRLSPRLQRHEQEAELHARVASSIAKQERPATAAARVDNREFCSPIEDQGNLGSCTAQACVGMVEYMQRRAGGRYIDGSRLFVYKTTRKLLGWTGDTGAFLRTTMKALVLFGVPPEEVWPYQISTFDSEPDPYLYAYASNYRAIRYLRIDAPSLSPDQTLTDLKAAIASGYAVMFGFSVYSSLTSAADIPCPSASDTLEGGHAVLAVGYDDDRPVQGPAPQGMEKGALLIRNSWSTGWGDRGYGWLPYAYLLGGLAADFWTCFSVDWVDSGQFE